MMAKQDNSAVRRVCRMLQVLKGHSVEGLALAEITKALGEQNPSTVMRTLDTLADESLVIKLDTGRWALSILMLQIAAATESEISRKSLRLTELKQRIAAGAAS